jgi:hypothetical protein
VRTSSGGSGKRVCSRALVTLPMASFRVKPYSSSAPRFH